jgi:hypothetical protein
MPRSRDDRATPSDPEAWTPTPGFTPRPLSPEIEHKVQAILDAEARRILEQELRAAGLLRELDAVESSPTRRRRVHQYPRHQ